MKLQVPKSSNILYDLSSPTLWWSNYKPHLPYEELYTGCFAYGPKHTVAELPLEFLDTLGTFLFHSLHHKNTIKVFVSGMICCRKVNS